MPRNYPPYCEHFKDRHGKLRVYFRRKKGGKRIALPPTIRSVEFDAACKTALTGEDPAEKTGFLRLPPAQGTIGALILSNQRSGAYVNLRPSTKSGYQSRLEIIRAAHGARTVAGLSRANTVGKVLGPFADQPGQSLAILKMLQVLIRHAVECGQLTHDPSLGVKRPKSNEIRSWTDQELQQFESRWEIGTKNSRIRVVQQKTGEKVDIPLHVALREVLASADRRHQTILSTE